VKYKDFIVNGKTVENVRLVRLREIKKNTASSFGNIFKILNIFHHQPSLAKKAFFSSYFTSAEKSLMATEEHFLCLMTFLFLSYLHIANHSPRVSPCSISINVILF